VKTISIKQLHAETGRWVRAAKTAPVIVTDRGEKVAALVPHHPAGLPKPVFSLESRGFRPKLPVDSTLFISEDRDGR
jgi:antitoxin (DNA-binding transcriptional repressor) of toxin-antitoxin stability system